MRTATIDSDMTTFVTSGDHLSRMHSVKPQRRVHDDKAAEKKAAKMLTAILLVFVITWLPYNVLVCL